MDNGSETTRGPVSIRAMGAIVSGRPIGVTIEDDQWIAREWALTQEGRQPAPVPHTPRHEPWCRNWPACPDCSAVARRYYPTDWQRACDPTPAQRVAQFYGGTGDSYSTYRAMHDHPWMVIGATIFGGGR